MTVHSRSTRQPESDRRCASCNHLRSEHGTTGTRPCLAMTGDLLTRNFCSCDEFRPV